MKHIKVKDHENLFRDPSTNCIVNKNMSEYQQYIKRRSLKEEEYKQIHKLESEVDIIKNELTEIKNLLRGLVNESR